MPVTLSAEVIGPENEETVAARALVGAKCRITSDRTDAKGQRQIVFGSDHACARMEDGPVFCWGSNKLGQLGDGGTESRTSPRRIKL